VLRAEYPHHDGQQLGVLVAGPGHVSSLPDPVREVALGVEGVRVFPAMHLLVCIEHPPLEIEGRRITAAVPEVRGDLTHAAAVKWEDYLCVREQRGENWPGSRFPRVIGDRSIDHRSSGLAPLIRHVVGHLIGGDRLHQAVHRHRPIAGQVDQRIPAQCGDRVVGC
jgi:hypothetical protein